MKILIASSEVFPYSKSGGLADMVGALAKSLAAARLEVAVVTPLYRGIRQRFPKLKRCHYLIDVPMSSWRAQGALWVLSPAPRLKVYFVEHQHYFDRAELYQENGEGYWDNHERFIFFAKSVVHLARYLKFQPDVIHVHDWQTALVPLLVQDQAAREGWGNPPRTVLTLHNLAYQGRFWPGAFPLTNLPPALFNPGLLEYHGDLNLLKGGILSADALTTVSERYAREILTPEFGCGLDDLLRRRKADLTGILNGVDYSEWKTARNPWLAVDYSAQRLAGKAQAKQAVQRELGLPPRPDVPLFGNISRLVHQKGSDILLGALEQMLSAELQFVLLGSGEPALEAAFLDLQSRFPDRVAVRIGYDHPLSHRIEAGCDFFVMPSRFEPSGLNQMYSLRYGTIPIVRATGGLSDSIVDATEDRGAADGIKFTELSSEVLAYAIRKALVLYQDDELMRHYRLNGMSMDFSWSRTAGEYIQIYRRLNEPKPSPRRIAATTARAQGA